MKKIEDIVICDTGSSILGPLDEPKLVKYRNKYMVGLGLEYDYLIGNGMLTNNDGAVYFNPTRNEPVIKVAFVGNTNVRGLTKKQFDSGVRLVLDLAKNYHFPIGDIRADSRMGRYFDLNELKMRAYIDKILEIRRDVRELNELNRGVFYDRSGKNGPKNN